ncbi:hypothetical protein OCU04_005015 [Sclerotinia nivalis]|uniref:Uncharacterized protein n=1 Tax=Sclerotinia nivalis TaxID=352851 RepID=A0A9X0AN89_9HELO|nr:hypothetical protein OCU04_005015 [Sclerotinia nivalis]
MSQQTHIQEFEMDFDQYLENLHSDLATWSAAFNGPLNNRIFRCFDALNRLHQKIVFITRRRDLLERSSVIPQDIKVELLSEYENLLDLMHPMRIWFENLREECQDYQEALRDGDEETIRFIEALWAEELPQF